MSRSLDRGAAGLLRGFTLLLSVLFPLLFLLVAWRRLHYPFEVDRMESGMMTSVWRLRQGYALYSPPSLQWAPFLYAPLFFYVSSAMTRVAGLGYPALRLVSILATLGSFGLIFALVLQETQRRWAPALFAVGLFASLYAFVDGWFDVGRVDSLALFFFLAALLATRRSNLILAAVLWCLAFLTKQTFLPLGFAVFLVEWRRPRRMLAGMAVYAALVALSVMWLQHRSHGWFTYYAFGTGGVIRWSLHTAAMFPFADLLAPLPIACGLIGTAAFLRRGQPWRGRAVDYFGIVSFLLTAAIWFVRGHEGANLNAVIPLYAWLAVVTGVSLDRLLEEAFHASGALLAAPVLWLLAAVQLAAHLYRPAEIQTGNLQARLAFLTALKQMPGDVWVVDHSYDGILAGKPLHADMDALDAVLGRGYLPAQEDFRRAVAAKAFGAVVLDRPAATYEPEGLFTAPPFSSVYRLRAVAPGAAASGDRDQPALVLRPCPVVGQEGGLEANAASGSCH